MIRKIALIFAFLFSYQNAIAASYVNVKYRDTQVDIGNGQFTCIATNESSFVRGACYDKNNKYMLIGLKGTVYHYCNLDKSVWINFTKTKSFGTYYNKCIKGKFSCKSGGAPLY